MSFCGVCRLLLVVILLLGQGLGQLFLPGPATAATLPFPATAEIAASFPTAPNALKATIPASVSPQAVQTCTSTYSSGGVLGHYVGLAGRITVTGGVPLPGAAIWLVDSQNQPLNLGNDQFGQPINPQFASDSFGSNPDKGFFAFPSVPVTTNVTLRFENPDYLTEFFQARYSASTSVLLDITRDPTTGNCIVKDKQGNVAIGGYPATSSQSDIVLYNLGGVAGQVTVAIPPASLYQNPPVPSPITDTTTAIPGATVEVVNYSVSNGSIVPGNPVSGANTTTDSAGYYLLGNIPGGSYLVRFKKTGFQPDPAAGGSYWRDGNFNFLPYYQAQTANYYSIQPITITATPSGGMGSYTITATDTVGDGSRGSYPGIQGINGHLVIPVSIAGTVRDFNGQTLSGATVEAYDSTGTTKLASSSATGINGLYILNNLVPNTTYRLKAIPSNGSELISRWFPANDLASSTPITTPAASSSGGAIALTGKDFTLPKGAQFSGVINGSNPSGPLGSVNVQVFDAGSGSSLPVDSLAVSAADGTYTTRAVLEPGKAYKLGFVPGGASQGFVAAFCAGNVPPLPGNNCSNASTLSTASTFTITAPSQVITANITLVHGANITGNIRGAQNEDLSAANLQVQVVILGANDGQLYQTFKVSAAASTVTYTTAALNPSDYIVQFVPVLGGNNTGYIPAYYSSVFTTGSATLAGATPVHVAAAAASSGIDVALVQGGQLTLNLTTRDKNSGQLISATNVLVQVFGGATATDPGTQITQGTTDANGRVTFSALPTSGSGGNPFALLVLPSGGLASAYVTTTSNVSKTLFSLVPGTAQQATYEISLGGSITGLISDPNNLAFDFSTTVISVYDISQNLLMTLKGSNFINCSQNPNGASPANLYCYYKVNLLPNRSYFLGFTPPAGSPYEKLYYNNVSSLANSTPLPVQNGSTLSGRNISFVPQGFLQVNVVDKNSNPLNGATVQLYDGNKQAIGSGPTGAGGIFTSQVLLAGAAITYFVSADKSGYIQNFYKDQPSLAAATGITITGGATTSIVITLNVPVCNPLVVTSNLDDGACGTLRYAVNTALASQTISITLSAASSSTITLTSGLTLPAGVKLATPFSCGSSSTPVLLGSGGSSGNGLTLSGNNQVSGIIIRGFSGRQLEAPPPGAAGKNILSCVKTLKT